jgi:hypothetical protein
LSWPRIDQSSFGWIFAVIYLLYPSTSAAIFEAFHCRRLSDNNMMVLAADYTMMCYDERGTIDPTYLAYLLFASFLVLAWSIGVPFFFWYKLYTNRKAIKNGNLAYYDIAPFRPLCMFLKPACYMYEIVFMAEKLVLCGMLGIIRVYLGGFILTNTISLMTTLVVMMLVVSNRPGKCEPYNDANIFSHGLIIVNLLCTTMLKVKDPNGPRPPGAVKRP